MIDMNVDVLERLQKLEMLYGLDAQRQVVADVESIGMAVLEMSRQLKHLAASVDNLNGAIRATRDDIPAARRRLAAVRGSGDYRAAWDVAEPLISVRIASYDRTEELIEVSLASVFAQDYENWEVIVVNDGPNAKTRTALERLGDSRIRYHELESRTPRADGVRAQWQTSGARPMNVAADLARGSWIAPLDDDDEFSPDHLSCLLEVARARGAEVAYGAFIQKITSTGEVRHLFSDPPAPSRFTMQSALYHSALRFFRYDEESWATDEPGDWNLARRWVQAGVAFAATPRVVATLHTTPYWDKK